MSERIGGTLAHLDAARDELRAERAATAAKILAAGRFALARMAELGHAFDDMVIDDWELAAAELGAELGISRARACTMITHGRDLITRLPQFAQVFTTGAVDMRVFRLIFGRTLLITDPDIMSVIDEQLAQAAPHWNGLSDARISDLIDSMIVEVDPEAVRRARTARKARFITIEPVGDGMVEIYGRIDAARGAIFDHSLDALARTVCPDDPRTHNERRADAVEPLSLGATAMACLCGNTDCPAAGNEVPRGHIVVHLIAEQDALAEAQATAEAADEDAPAPAEQPEAAPTRPARPALLPGYGPIPAEQLRDLLPYTTIRPLATPEKLGTELGYRPSRALTDFIGCRDLICRWPGCSIAAQRCDVDHTVPWPYGPTHPSNTKGYCRIHHLIKTFHCGPGGWNDQQHPDGTITITAPNGRVYMTKPGGALFFPQLATPTTALILPSPPPPSPDRRLAAPRRRRTRAQNRAYRIAHERAQNRADIEANPPPF